MIGCVCGGTFEIAMVLLALTSAGLGGLGTHIYNLRNRKKCCDHKCKAEVDDGRTGEIHTEST